MARQIFENLPNNIFIGNFQKSENFVRILLLFIVDRIEPRLQYLVRVTLCFTYPTETKSKLKQTRHRDYHQVLQQSNTIESQAGQYH